MMDKFEIGEIAEIINAKAPFLHLIGCEVGITKKVGVRSPYGVCYEGEISGSLPHPDCLEEIALRKNKPPAATWQEVQQITGWSPIKEKVAL
jgi:hypothetical protein